MVCHGVKAKQFASAVKKKMNLYVNDRTVQRVLSSSPHIKCTKCEAAIGLTEMRNANRLNLVEEKLLMETEEWNHVMFTDDKTFNVHGPGRLQLYRHDMKNKPELSSKCVLHGRSVMVWCAIFLKE